MARINEAFCTLDNQKIHNLDYSFIQKSSITEENKHKKIMNYILITIPKNIDISNVKVEIEIYGDMGYQYSGNIITHKGLSPNLLIPIGINKKMFASITNKLSDENVEKYIAFINIPKKHQSN